MQVAAVHDRITNVTATFDSFGKLTHMLSLAQFIRTHSTARTFLSEKKTHRACRCAVTKRYAAWSAASGSLPRPKDILELDEERGV